ncbi:unnamed protein product [Mycena citricolor]|uniref:BAG domain-containing protein n=1 Tax=Mycena citricolor TaxID=2018698 RepID=A0AAD2H666_9AGAR|nr:unnamed protein product [Mycena citricolor]
MSYYQYYPSAQPAYFAAPIPAPALSARDKYLAALAQAESAKAEFEAAERLQQEEAALRQRLEQIQRWRGVAPAYPQHPAPYYPSVVPGQLPLPFNAPPIPQQPVIDIEAIRAEERAKILREQQEKRESERRARAEAEARAEEQRAQEQARARALALRQEQLAQQHQARLRFLASRGSGNPCNPVRCTPPSQLDNSTAVIQALSALGLPCVPQPKQPAPAPRLERKPAIRRPTQDEPIVSEPAKAQPAPTPTAGPSEKKPTPATKPSEIKPQVFGLEQVLNHLGAGSVDQNDVQQFLNALFGGNDSETKKSEPQASSSGSVPTPSSPVSTVKRELETRLQSEQAKEDQDLAEAIRLSLADIEDAASQSKGKSAAPAPVPDVSASAAEIRAIDAAFTQLSSDFATPSDLEFSSSRTSSPVRSSFSSRRALTRGLLTRLDSVESFGDDGLRHARKEVVAKVEGALEEVEAVVEAKWREVRWQGEGGRSCPEATPAPEVVEESSPDVSSETDSAPPSLKPSQLEASATVTQPSESVATLKPYDVEPVDESLLPAEVSNPPTKASAVKEEDVASDWSELDA